MSVAQGCAEVSGVIRRARSLFGPAAAQRAIRGRPFNTGDYNPTYDVQTPLPAAPFGPAWDVPSVPPLPTGGTHQF
jgi:hypothetical protein